jgi:hypothetical protein
MGRMAIPCACECVQHTRHAASKQREFLLEPGS